MRWQMSLDYELTVGDDCICVTTETTLKRGLPTMAKFPLILLIGLWTALALSANQAGPAKDHDGNALLGELLKEGLDVGGKAKVVFPAPTMDDGLDAAAQKKVMEKLIDKSYELDDFVRNSVVAPNMLRLRNIEPSDPNAPARGVDFWFVAYGDWAKISDKDFLERSWNSAAKENKAKPLAAADLAKRNIVLGADGKNQALGHGTFVLFSKVEVSGTGISSWSKTENSFILAGKVDQRFDKDAEFPNQWRSMKKDDTGANVFGKPQPYHGAGYYMKLTRLREPAGAVFVEGHVIFAEPKGWFDGENVLRSKLPLGVQNQVRALRREFLR
jgi:hypothetical protein